MSQRDDPLGIGVAVGDVLAGKFRVERVLGHGGMGAVVAAHHLVLDEKVALKFLLPSALSNPEAAARFVREARAAVRIKSEHVARVTDVGHLDSGAPYIVMEYLEGTDLAVWLQTAGPLPVDHAVDFVLQACEALADAHALGIVHRDLKPANLFCIRRSNGQLCIKVLDFGISKIMTPTGASDMTRTNAVVGTPFYMSPEQMQSSRSVDARTDIWSLGVILFELITGRTPFEGQSMSELAIKVATVAAPSLRSLRANAPAGLERVVATCLEKDRNRRFQSVGDFALALRDFGPPGARASVERILATMRHAGITGPNASGGADAQALSAPSTASSWGHTHGARRGRRAVLGAAAVAVVLLGAGLFALRVFPSRGGVPPGPAAANHAPAAASIAAGTVPPPASSEPLPSLVEPTGAPPPPSAPSAPSAAPPAPVPPATPPRPPARPPPPGRRGAVPSASSPGPPPAVPSAACSPPYYFDADGHKQYKPECM